MMELLRESILPVNLPFTLLLGAVAIYWAVALFGLVDLDGGGGEGADGFAGDGAGEGAVDGGGHDGGGHDGHEAMAEGGKAVHGGGALHAAMKFVGAADVPLIFVLSLFSLMLWGLNVGLNHYLNPGFDGARASLLLIPVVLGAFVATRLLVIPLRPLARALRKPEAPAEIIGAEGVVRSARLDREFGEIEVFTSGKFLILRARLGEGGNGLRKGDKVLVVAKAEGGPGYVVRPLDTPELA